MKKREISRINRRYDERLAKYGYNIRSLASGTKERRDIRYQILTEIGFYPHCTVLDLGCGFGDFYSYLKKKRIKAEYTGYDINPNFIQIARKKYPDGRFEVADIQKRKFPKFDFIVASSVFNLKLRREDNYAFIKDILHICYRKSVKGVAIDFLSSYCEYKMDDIFYYSPEKVFSIAKSITKRVCLRHDYKLFEFCIYLYPDFKGWKRSL